LPSAKFWHLFVSDKLNLRDWESQVTNGGKYLFPKFERRVPPLFAWHPDQKLPGVEPQIVQWNKPIERVRIDDLLERFRLLSRKVSTEMLATTREVHQ